MLANNLTLDEEDAVQAELKELEQQAVRVNVLIFPLNVYLNTIHRPRMLRHYNPSNFLRLPSQNPPLRSGKVS